MGRTERLVDQQDRRRAIGNLADARHGRIRQHVPLDTFLDGGLKLEVQIHAVTEDPVGSTRQETVIGVFREGFGRRAMPELALASRKRHGRPQASGHFGIAPVVGQRSVPQQWRQGVEPRRGIGGRSGTVCGTRIRGILAVLVHAVPGRGVLVVVRIDMGAQPPLTEPVKAADRLCLALGLGEGRQEKPREDRDDGDHDEQLDQRERRRG